MSKFVRKLIPSLSFSVVIGLSVFSLDARAFGGAESVSSKSINSTPNKEKIAKKDEKAKSIQPNDRLGSTLPYSFFL